MVNYYGVLKSGSQAAAWARKLREIGGDRNIGMASMLERNWHYIAARPAIQPEIIAAMNTTGLDHAKKGSIVGRILAKAGGAA